MVTWNLKVIVYPWVTNFPDTSWWKQWNFRPPKPTEKVEKFGFGSRTGVWWRGWNSPEGAFHGSCFHLILEGIRRLAAKNLAIKETSKLSILTCHRFLRKKTLVVAADREGFEAGAEGDCDVGAKVIVTISIGCRIVGAPIVCNQTLDDKFRLDWKKYGTGQDTEEELGAQERISVIVVVGDRVNAALRTQIGDRLQLQEQNGGVLQMLQAIQEHADVIPAYERQ
ncbi:hypothetical protein B0H13DRAFT_2484616 [Mycena leptocephala]|nr:hypothetical protein B0H13DRAFT_2484616 [Mycena leptocephala]